MVMAEMAEKAAMDDAVDGRPPTPFLKWAGGKRQIAEVLVERLPPEFSGQYVEPFIGGGALFFDLFRRGRVRRARLSDVNAELIDAYRAVRNHVDAVIDALGRHRNEEAHYYEVRAEVPASLSLAARAARTIFLNRVGFNGLYRVNASGGFNVPFGRYANPKICDPEGLRAASRALQCAELDVCDFDAACAHVTAGDVVYFDPPYVPVSATASFTSYARGGFGVAEQHRLAATFARVADAGAVALLSNSDTPLARELYAPFKIARVDANRAINSRGDRRGAVSELVVQGVRV